MCAVFPGGEQSIEGFAVGGLVPGTGLHQIHSRFPGVTGRSCGRLRSPPSLLERAAPVPESVPCAAVAFQPRSHQEILAAGTVFLDSVQKSICLLAGCRE